LASWPRPSSRAAARARRGPKAAEYLSGLFGELGLRGLGEAGEAYLQNFAMTVKTPVSCYLESDHGRADNWTDFMELHSDFAGRRIAEAFASAARDGRRPARNVVFLAPDAEELGGLGSKFYLEHPLFPLSGVLADINIDGIGREDAERPGLRDFVHLYLSRNGRADLASVRDRALEWTAPSLRVEPRENYSGSDHAFFEERLIPAIAFSTGQPRDHHRPTDTPDMLGYRNIRDIARLAFAMAWEIAFDERPIERIVSE